MTVIYATFPRHARPVIVDESEALAAVALALRRLDRAVFSAEEVAARAVRRAEFLEALARIAITESEPRGVALFRGGAE